MICKGILPKWYPIVPRPRGEGAGSGLLPRPGEKRCLKVEVWRSGCGGDPQLFHSFAYLSGNPIFEEKNMYQRLSSINRIFMNFDQKIFLCCSNTRTERTEPCGHLKHVSIVEKMVTCKKKMFHTRGKMPLWDIKGRWRFHQFPKIGFYVQETMPGFHHHLIMDAIAEKNLWRNFQAPDQKRQTPKSKNPLRLLASWKVQCFFAVYSKRGHLI